MGLKTEIEGVTVDETEIHCNSKINFRSLFKPNSDWTFEMQKNV